MREIPAPAAYRPGTNRSLRNQRDPIFMKGGRCSRLRPRRARAELRQPFQPQRGRSKRITDRHMTGQTTRTITTPLALTCTHSARLMSPWFVQQSEYDPAKATYLPLVNGEKTFGAVFDAIMGAQHSIDILCWGFQPSMYFKRGTDGAGSPSIGDLLATKGEQGVKVRLLVWSDFFNLSHTSEDMMPGNHGPTGLATAAKDGRTHAQEEYDWLWYHRANLNNVTAHGLADRAITVTTAFFPGVLTDRAVDSLRSRKLQPLKNIEFATRDFNLWERGEIAYRTWLSGPAGARVMRTENTAAMTGEPSHHQKMVLVDYEAPEQAIGFVMGHNTLDEYWDRDNHTYLRMAPRMGRSGLHPRQDMSAKVTGPILEDLNENFCQAWDDATGQKLGQARSALACRLKLRPEHGTPVMAQILRTQSQHPKGGTRDISKLYLQAVNNATNFVYIENQYLRYMPVVDALRKNVNAQLAGGRSPGKHGPVYLFVVTNSNEDGIGKGTVGTYQMLSALGYGDRMPGVAALELPDQQKTLETQLADERAADQRLMTQGVDFSQMQGLGAYLQDRQFKEGEEQRQLDQVRQARERVKEHPDGLTRDKDLIPPQDMPGLKVLICTLVAPDTPAGQKWDYVYIHQKLMIVDDVFTTHGSANVNRRSMEVDSELNICHEHGEATSALRKQLWGLHTKNRGAQDDISKAYKEWGKVISQNTQNQGKKLAPIASLVGFLTTSPTRSSWD